MDATARKESFHCHCFIVCVHIRRKLAEAQKCNNSHVPCGIKLANLPAFVLPVELDKITVATMFRFYIQLDCRRWNKPKIIKWLNMGQVVIMAKICLIDKHQFFSCWAETVRRYWLAVTMASMLCDTQYNVVECSNASKTKAQCARCLDYAVLLSKPYVQTTHFGQRQRRCLRMRMFCATTVSV